ncbi:MAG: histidine kinase [Acidobacteriota bacterium]|nr:histidine kinase [Acidobacteriota bacterium]
MTAARAKIIVLCLLVGFGLFVVAANGVRAERLPIKIYMSADGLGSSFVDSVMRDSHGFLWFGTRDGLSRFDGYRFNTYSIGKERARPTIWLIRESQRGNYWISTNRGLYRFKPDALRVVDAQADTGSERSLAAERVSDLAGNLFEDQADNFWFVSGGKVFRVEDGDEKAALREIDLALPPQLAASFSVSESCAGRDGSLWLVTNHGLLRRLPDHRLIHFALDFTPEASTDLLADNAGRIWLTHQTGLYVFNPELLDATSQLGPYTARKFAAAKTVTLRQGEPARLPDSANEIVRFLSLDGLTDGVPEWLYQTSDGHLWVTTTKGLVEFDGQNFHAYTAAQGFDMTLTRMAEDSHGNLWIGADSGAVRLDRKGLTTYGTADGLGKARIRSLYENRDGELYVVNDHSFVAFVSEFDGAGFRSARLPVPDLRFGWSSNGTFPDSAGEWWVLSTDTLYRFAATGRFEQLSSQKPLAAYTSRDGLKSDRMYCMFEDSRSDLWISTMFPSGLSRWHRASGKFQTFSEAEGYPPDRAAASFVEDKTGALWFGFYEGGLARYTDGRFTFFTAKDGLPEGFITDLHLDRVGRLWLSSALGGLSRLDDLSSAVPRFVTYTTADGLSSNNVRCITEDWQGRIYVGTARGVCRLTPETGLVKHYSINDGLAADFVNVAHRDRGGALWFGTPNGLSRLVPEPEHPAADTAPPVWLGGLRIAGDEYPLPELGSAEIAGLELSPAQRNVQIDFFAIDFSPGAKLRYQYMLEGADQDWSEPLEQRTVNYAKLPPGAFRFLVRAVNADGSHSLRPASISFRILPPVWQRWWFLTLVAAAVTFVIHAGYRYRLARLLELERVRTHIATDLHDDIGASLSRMAILSEVVKQQGGTLQVDARERLTNIAETARDLVDSMSDIVWATDPRRDDLRNVVLRVRQFAADVLEAKGIKWTFDTPPDLARIKLTPEQRRQLFLIFKEALNNIARHAACRTVTLNLTVTHQQLLAEIHDDGRGFTDAPIDALSSNGRGGHGLENMRARAEGVGGRLEINSSPDAGTHLTLVMPLAKTRQSMNMLFSRRRK